jgi:hypothetical protein
MLQLLVNGRLDVIPRQVLADGGDDFDGPDEVPAPELDVGVGG